MGLTVLNVIVLAIVVFVNGLTDAPNAIATTVTTKSMTLKQAVVLSSVMNFLGVSISYVIKPAVVSNILQIFSFNDNERNIQTALCSAMFSVAVWAVTAWIFGIPTSESHALLAALAGAELAISNGRITHFAGIWLNIINGIIISSAIGFGVAAILSSVLNRKSKKINMGNAVLYLQKILSALLSFLHGAQDGQKMIGILLLILQNTSFSLFAEYISVIFCSL
ncbi:MAG: inorganic phosphate transporter, partial [Clostridia bacterium]|nr:inorganic phosphate transporter [Clostridia bacterium]